MTYKVIHNTLVNKVQTQAICNCRRTARAVIWSTSYFPNVSIFLLTALGGLPENPDNRCSRSNQQQSRETHEEIPGKNKIPNQQRQ